MGFTWIEKGIEPIDGFLTYLEYECNAEVNERKYYKRQTAALWPSSAICGGLLFPQAGLTAETAWKAGESELICLHGGLRFHYIGRMAKNFRPVFEISVLHLCLSLHFICLSFPASQNNRKSADKLSDG